MIQIDSHLLKAYCCRATTLVGSTIDGLIQDLARSSALDSRLTKFRNDLSLDRPAAEKEEAFE